MINYGIIDLPRIAIIGKEGLCTKEKNIVQNLWQQANSNFSEIADLGMKNADGSFVGFWGAMSDETMSFMPWTDDFSRGLYLAGIEVYEDTPFPDGWVKWVTPARKYLVTEVTPESYGGTFRNLTNKPRDIKKSCRTSGRTESQEQESRSSRPNPLRPPESVQAT